jgi:hypothetical protein
MQSLYCFVFYFSFYIFLLVSIVALISVFQSCFVICTIHVHRNGKNEDSGNRRKRTPVEISASKIVYSKEDDDVLLTNMIIVELLVLYLYLANRMQPVTRRPFLFCKLVSSHAVST